jgi:hypothetical protein
MTKMKASMMRPSSAPVLRSESIACFASRIAAGQESSAYGPIFGFDWNAQTPVVNSL